MAQRKNPTAPDQSDNSSADPRTQDRPSNLRLGPLTPEQAISGIFRIKSADVERIKAEEKRMRAKPKRGRK